MKTLHLQATIAHPEIMYINNYHYDPDSILKRVSDLFDDSSKKSDWWQFLKEDLSSIWQGLPKVSENLSPEQWMQRNYNRFIVLKGFELLSRPLEVRLKNALLDVNNVNKRGNLIRIWQELGENPVSRLERPKYEMIRKLNNNNVNTNLWKNFRKPINKPLIIAHRGGYSQFPENSLAAFQYAYSLGVVGVECDLRLSNDGVVFILHDNDLEFLSGVKLKVSFLSSKQLLSLKLRDSINHNKHSSESPLTLESLLKEYGGKMLLWLELKPDGGKNLPHKVGDLIERYNLVDQVIVSSFSSEMLRVIRLRFPNLILAYEFKTLKENYISPLLAAPDKHRIVISADHPELFTPDILLSLVKAGVSTSSYTLNRFDAIQKAIDSNIKFIQTNRPERALLLIQNP
jgi:glycerophosphoryl diester phosphodiesterase